MRVRLAVMFGLLFGLALAVPLAAGGPGASAAEQLGLDAKKPVVAAACKSFFAANVFDIV